MKFFRALIVACVLAVTPLTYADINQLQTITLLTNGAASGSQKTWPGGYGMFSAVGTWNGATVTLQFVGPDGTSLVTAGTGTTFTANNGGVFFLPRGTLIQATITNAGGSTSLTVSAVTTGVIIG